MNQFSVLILPGWTNSGPDHWQSHWERSHPEYRRVEQEDWDCPDRADWMRRIDAAVRESESQVFFLAHSLGCIAFVGWVADAEPHLIARVSGAFLVAPADIERENAPGVLHS